MRGGDRWRSVYVARCIPSSHVFIPRRYDVMDDPDIWAMMGMAVMIGFVAAMLMFHVI